MNTRTCYICGQTKPITEFRTNNRESLKKGYECKQCDNVASRNYVTTHAIERNLKRRIKYATDKEWRLKEMERRREYYRRTRH